MPPQLVACPSCREPRAGGSRYCTCGFDYWRAAQLQAAGVTMAQLRRFGGKRITGIIGRSLALATTLVLALSVAALTLAALPGQNGGSLLDQVSGGRIAMGRIGQSSELYGGPGSEVVDAFLETATAADVSFHVDFSGTVSVSDPDGGSYQTFSHMSAALDVAGDDWSGYVDAASPGEMVAANVIYVDGSAWARAPGTVDWQASTFEPSQPMNPFTQVEGPDEIDYQGTSLVDGQVLHHLRISRWLGNELAALPEDLEVSRTDASFDVYTTPGGVPVYATLTQTLHAEMNDAQNRIETPAEYRFSRWGEPILIQAPPTSG